jgi:hypothetical protein
LIAHLCARPAIIVDLCDAAAFIDMHGGLIDQTTKTPENAPRRVGMLD